jgi:hypothetical protein
MTSAISKKLNYSVSQQFKEGFYESSPTLGYVFIGNHLSYQDENNPPSITDSIRDEKTVWNNMIAAKKITGTDVELVIPRVNWIANTRYKQYDDAISVSDLITACAAVYNVASITVNTNAVGVNSFVTFTGGGTSNVAANARIYVNSRNYIINVEVIANGSYTSTPTATVNTGNGVLTVITNSVSPYINPVYVMTTSRNHETHEVEQLL